MNHVKNIYRIARGTLFAVVLTVAAVYVIAYVLLSIPSFQNYIKTKAEQEASAFLGGDVCIGNLSVYPFSEVQLDDVHVKAPDGKEVAVIERLGAGIRVWKLLNGQIEISYAEVIGLDARVVQAQKDGPLNIAFIIDAFKPKEKNKSAAKFDLKMHSVVLRKCAASFDREWQPYSGDSAKMDVNHIRLYNLRADISLPRLSDREVRAYARRMAFGVSGGLKVESLSFDGSYSPVGIALNRFELCLPHTKVELGPMQLGYPSPDKIMDALQNGTHRLALTASPLAVSDLSFVAPVLAGIDKQLDIKMEVQGNLDNIAVETLTAESEGLQLSLKGGVQHIVGRDSLALQLETLSLNADMASCLEVIKQAGISARSYEKVARYAGNVRLECTGGYEASKHTGDAKVSLRSGLGNITCTAECSGINKEGLCAKGEIDLSGCDIGKLTGVAQIGRMSGNVGIDVSIKGKDADGEILADVTRFEVAGKDVGGLSASLLKSGNWLDGDIFMDNELGHIEAEGECLIAGEKSEFSLKAVVDRLTAAALYDNGKYTGYGLACNIEMALCGDGADNAEGYVRAADIEFGKPGEKTLRLGGLSLTSDFAETGRQIVLRSDWIDGKVGGDFRIKEILPELKHMASAVVPSLMPGGNLPEGYDSTVEFDFNVKADNNWTEFLNLPVRLLVDVPVKGAVDGVGNTAWIKIDVPYLQQGKNKLVRNTSIDVRLDGESGTCQLNAATTFPAKKGDMRLNIGVDAQDDSVFADIGWETPGNSSFKGKLLVGAEIFKNETTGDPGLRIEINPSTAEVGSATWQIGRGLLTYDDRVVNVEGLKIWHGSQFLEIDGTASASPDDTLWVRLAGIDLDYIFETLAINYVSFGGIATGVLQASGALGGNPTAYTDNLAVKGLAYNGSVLGDALLRSHWDNEAKEVAISADITSDEGRQTTIDGGIWVTRDSLSFDLDADRIRVGFMAPFMKAFARNVRGRASGRAKLFGTFSDIDLTGRIFADSLALTVDYTNVEYHGSDSVILNPGKIEIRDFRLYDRYGKSGILNGTVSHRYFHEPSFNFRVSDVRGMLVYNTNPQINPDWYGKLYGNGSAVVKGWPGTVSVSADMTTTGKSEFTFVLNDTEAASDYRFLTFSDRQKEEREKVRADSLPAVLATFRKKLVQNADTPSKFMMDIRGTIHPDALLTLVMDPVAGDKITAHGNGNVQIDYNSESDEMQMFGKYTLEEGNYNFSLQDLILRDFAIRRGSNISFNGDPFNARLDIAASYRVNTNLSDLDKSFSTDRELTRTNVPVDAVLIVKGELSHPDITFDIELPTLTQDTERKVKSIISTEDMMSRQIIYLLALNRFYTPEYMGSTGNGGELASVASSTLSSQLSNILGQLTDKLTLAPSFRSDKGDFSDVEVDVALSSKLLNNRLLVNGNFGYRDRNTSTTTFVGDFDIEYLLSRSGNLRLKAYNHFNDQNYYLRQALTTQGLGVIYRKDFDNPFTFLKRRKKRAGGAEGASGGTPVPPADQNTEESK